MREFLNEKGITSKKYFNSDAHVDLEYIKSTSYKCKFRKITKNNKLNEILYKVSKSIFIHRNSTYLEDLYLVDSNKCCVVAKNTHAKFINKVDYNEEMNEIIKNHQDYSLISIHNHGTNIPPTGSDFVSCAQKKYKFGLVVCHDGSVFKYKPGNSFITVSLIDKRVEKYKQNSYNLNVKDAHIKALNELKKEYGIEWEEL